MRLLSGEELTALLRPWLGEASTRIALPLPGVIELHLRNGMADTAALAASVQALAPGTLLEDDDRWASRLALLARSLQACAGAALASVGFVSAAVIAVVTRSGLAARRDAIETVHGLGATDDYIAVRFARRATALAGFGALAGSLAALPVLAGLTRLAEPLTLQPSDDPLAVLPVALWVGLPALPLAAAGIGWLTAHTTVRRWLRRLP